MFNDLFLEKIFAHPEMAKIPVGAQATAVNAFEEILENMLEVNPYVAVSELLISTTTDESISTEF